MKNSIGTDLAEVARIRKAMENPRFLVEFFTEAERSYILARHTPEQSAAGAWAAKEAFSKAVGQGSGAGRSGRWKSCMIRWEGRSPAAWTGSQTVCGLCIFAEHQPHGCYGFGGGIG